jgi:hypothetical protein
MFTLFMSDLPLSHFTATGAGSGAMRLRGIAPAAGRIFRPWKIFGVSAGQGACGGHQPVCLCASAIWADQRIIAFDHKHFTVFTA